MSVITMTGYMGAITAGAPFIMDYGQKDVEELVRVSDVQPADDVCCKVRLEGMTFWMPEIEFRRRATPVATPANGEQVERADEENEEVAFKRDIAEKVRNYFAATPTEDARERVKEAVESEREWSLPDLRDVHSDVQRIRDHDLGNKRMRDLLRATMDTLVAADAEYAALGNKETDRHG